MGERLRARDLAFLTAETATTPMHNATVEIFDPGTSGFDYDTLVALIADRIAFVPRYRQRVRWVPGPPRQPGLGRRPALRPRLPRTPLGAAASRDAWTSCASWSPGSSPGRWTGTGRCGRSTSSRGSRTAGSRCCPRPTRRSSTAPRSSTSPRCCSTATPSRRELGADEWRPGRPVVARPAWCSRRSATRVATPSTALDTAARHRRLVLARRRRRDRGAWARVVDALANRRSEQDTPIGGTLSQQRRFVTVRSARSPTTATVRDAHGGTVNDVILATVTGGAAGLADDPRRVAGRTAPGPGRGAGVGARPRARGDLARHPDRARTSSTCRSASRARWSGCTRCPTPSRRTRRPAARSRPTGSPASPASRRRRSTRSGRGSPPSRGTARLPALGHQRARSAVPAVRRGRGDGADLPGAAAAARATPWRSA